MNLRWCIHGLADLVRLNQPFRVLESGPAFPNETNGVSELGGVSHLVPATLALGLAWPGASMRVTASEDLAAGSKDPPAPYRSPKAGSWRRWRWKPERGRG